jgi:hypothetical protein
MSYVEKTQLELEQKGKLHQKKMFQEEATI